MHILVDSSDVGAYNGLRRLILGLFEQVWPQPVDHYLVVKRLIVQFLVEFSVALMSLSFLLVDVLESLLFFILLASVLLQHGDLLSHLLLGEQVVLDAALEYFCSLSAFITNPPGVTLFVEIGVGHLFDVEQNIIGRLV